MRYVLMDVRKNDAIWTENLMIWMQLLLRAKKKNVKSFYVLESVNPDETADNHYDGNIIKEWK